MPYIVPDIPYAFASKTGASGVDGSLAPTQDGPISRVGANIRAGPPVGVIATTVSWGAVIGQAPAGTSALIVAATGRTLEFGATIAYGGYAGANAYVSITVEEFSNGAFTRSVSGTAIPMLNLWSAPFGIQKREFEGNPNQPNATPQLIFAGARPGRTYRVWVNANHSVQTYGMLGFTLARSNCHFDFYPIFYTFL
jgi:hypothetical protein